MTLFQLLVQPLILIPGVALLILSTSMRYGPLDTELRRAMALSQRDQPEVTTHLRYRARLFQFGLLALYAATGLLVMTSMIGAVLSFTGEDITVPVVVLTCLSFILVLLAILSLCREVIYSTKPVEISNRQVNKTSGGTS